MNVSITPQLETFLRECVKAGRFNNTSEAVRAAIRLLQNEEAEYEEKLVALRTDIQEGLKGPFEPLDMENIKREAREEWEQSKANA
jgi:antitoxin ParD1/3/4